MMIAELNIRLEAHEKTTAEIRVRKEDIDQQSAEFNQWMTRIKARLEAIAGKIERAKNNTK